MHGRPTDYAFPTMHKVLTLKYGDYMQLPDIESVNLHVGKLRISS